MTSNIASRRAAGAITAALVLGTAGPAVARTIEDPGLVPVAPPAHVHQTAHHGKAIVLPRFAPAHTKAFAETTAPVAPAASASAAKPANTSSTASSTPTSPPPPTNPSPRSCRGAARCAPNAQSPSRSPAQSLSRSPPFPPNFKPLSS